MKQRTNMHIGGAYDWPIAIPDLMRSLRPTSSARSRSVWFR